MSRRGIELVSDGKGGYAGRDSRGRQTLSIEAPTVFDANGRPGKVTLTVTADTATFQIDPTFLQSAAWPIVVDRTVLYLQESMSASSSGYEGLVLGDSPLAYFRLNEQAGAPGAPITVLDTSGNGYTGTTVPDVTPNQVGALTTGGDSDPAMRFEGTNLSQIQVSSGFDDLSSGVTVEAWISRLPRPSGLGSSTSEIETGCGALLTRRSWGAGEAVTTSSSAFLAST